MVPKNYLKPTYLPTYLCDNSDSSDSSESSESSNKISLIKKIRKQNFLSPTNFWQISFRNVMCIQIVSFVCEGCEQV